MSIKTTQTELSAYVIETQHNKEDPVTFPFSWVIGEKVITTISELSHDEKEKAKKKRKACSLCGSREIEYEKKSGRFLHLICKDCAIRYVRNAWKLNSIRERRL
jgi:hypothetical protein